MPVQQRKSEGGSGIPLVMEADGRQTTPGQSLTEWLQERRGWFEEKLLLHGGVLLRGLPIRTTQDFASFLEVLSPELVRYVGGQSERSTVEGDIYTSTDLSPLLSIPLHSEMSYLREPPSRIYFFCQKAAEQGGETPIADCRCIFERMEQLHPALCEKFSAKGVLYVKNMHDEGKAGPTFGISWQAHFETDCRQQVEEFLNKQNAQFEWSDDGGLSTRSVRPAVQSHPKTGETVWLNQAHLWHPTNLDPKILAALKLLCGEDGLPTNAYFGDGSPIADSELECVRDVLSEEAVTFPWQEGDVLILDNFMAAHGRRPYEGDRKVLVAMA